MSLHQVVDMMPWWVLPTLAWVVFHRCVYWLGFVVTPLYWRPYRERFTFENKIYWNDIGPTDIHACVWGFVVGYIFCTSDFFSPSATQWGGPLVNRVHPWLPHLFCYSCAYFLNDGALVLRYPFLGAPNPRLVVVHHILCTGALIIALQWGQGYSFSTIMGAAEVTSPFIGMRWRLDVSGKRHGPFYIINGLTILALWLPIRIVNYGLFILHIALNYDEMRSQYTPLAQVYSVGSLLFIQFLNIIWFAKIVRGAVRALTGKYTPKNEKSS
eukprot:GDKH01018365.1.p1 GENE.GDKH01018365.1~~GDKH01018365.1.p1  ORF type:complete len:270 (-),score=44.13 GDKH01018365.1:247-1056(-)